MEVPPSAITTHYYKLAHLGVVSFAIYLSPQGNDQQLLETELELRSRHPRILVTYNNKCLFYFCIEGDQLDLEQEFPNVLKLKHSATVPISRFTAQPKPQTPSQVVGDEMYLPFANISFVKAVKKMVIYQMSLVGDVELFGNYCLIVPQCRVTFIDPILFPSGDLVVSIIIKNTPRLQFARSLDWTVSEVNFVIYTIPTAIRCHLFYPNSLASSIVSGADVENVTHILNLIRLSTGHVFKDDVMWVKLIPNLKQWNNHTSTISKFIHTIENKKCILWPLDLCVIHEGDVDVYEPPKKRLALEGPASIIDEFINFNIAHSQEIPPPPLPGSSLPPSEVTPSVSELFGGEEFEIAPVATATNDKSAVSDESMDIDDLFGGDDQPPPTNDEVIFNLFGDVPEPDSELHQPPPSEKLSPVNRDDLKKTLPRSIVESFIDIPKDQMTISKDTPGYSDPGAPVPIILTPMIQSGPPSVPPPPPPPPAIPQDVDEKQDKSAFSPILFNPIIKRNIDTKYGKGGKFFVDKLTQEEPPQRRRESIRETSVLGIHEEKPRWRQDESEIVSDSSESDADDDQPPPATEEIFPGILAPREYPTVTSSTPPKDASAPFISAETPQFRKDSFRGGQSGLGFLASPGVKSMYQMKDSPFDSITPPVIEVEANTSEGEDSDVVDEVAIKQATPPPGLATPDSSVNYLPFILRSASISTIPAKFYLNNQREVPASFNIDEVQVDDFDSLKRDQMVVSSKDIDVLLKYLHETMIFDMNLNSVAEGTPSYSMPPVHFADAWHRVFPQSYPMSMLELLEGFQPLQTTELDDQLDFLGDITTDYDENENGVLTGETNGAMIKRLLRKLHKIEWEGISGVVSPLFAEYKQLLDQLLVPNLADEWNVSEQVFSLPDCKTRVIKNSQLVNLNSIALPFWNYLNFSPIKPAKKFQIVALGRESTNIGCSYLQEFVSAVANNYFDGNLGTITKLNLHSIDTRPDLANIVQGVIPLVDDDYQAVSQCLTQLVEVIKLDLINKTRNFEFDRPLLILFVNFQENNHNSLLQIAKVFRDFHVALRRHQLPVVKFFTKVIPASYLVKQDFHGRCRVRPFSTMALTKMSLNLYSICPDIDYSVDAGERWGTNLYTQIVKDPPQRIQFKFMQNYQQGKGTKGSFNDDIFLHLAFDRSLDRHWISCAWSDPYGVVTMSKSWHCNQKAVGDIIDEIWLLSAEFCKRINDELQNKTSSMGGKRFLVLTRISSVILDDELVHWKRLTTKHKEMALIVLSVNKSPMETFTKAQPTEEEKEKSSAVMVSGFPPFNPRENTSPGALVTSPNFHSPQQFLNSGQPGFFSPSDTINGGTPPTQSAHSSSNPASDVLLHDPRSDIWGVIPYLPLPSSNSPSKLGMKMGYLTKEVGSKLLTFEVSLLSCPNYWSLDHLMQLILKQYKSLILLNGILGVSNGDHDLVPWHVKAVGKALDYIVHIYVE